MKIKLEMDDFIPRTFLSLSVKGSDMCRFRHFFYVSCRI